MIKNVFLFVFAIILFSCKTDAPKDYVTFSGKIANHSGTDGSIVSQKGYKKVIKINEDGTFSDTLHLKEKGVIYQFSDGNEYAMLYLKNGDDIKLTLDTKEFDETLKFKGEGAENNNYLAAKSLLSEKILSKDLFNLDKEAFTNKISEIITEFNSFLASFKNLDTDLVASEKEGFLKFEKDIKQQYAIMKGQKEENALFVGKPSPQFVNYENYKGGTTSLKDLIGKYVYIDVWATWCKPCLGEIPHLQQLEKEFHDKNIEFVSISVDKEKAHDTWKKMIADKKMGGIQLFAGKDSKFSQEYKITSIPRFILIDPKGNVVDANAKRPSDPTTKGLLAKLLE